MPKKDYRRRTRLLIAKKFQLKYILLMTFLVLLTVLITGYTIYVTTWIMFGEKLAAVYPQTLLIEIIENINNAIFIRLAVLMPVVIIIGLIFSSRIAGPVFNIKRYLHKISHGTYDMTKIKLRENDEFNDLAHEINNLVDRLKSDRAGRIEQFEAIEEAVGEIESNLGKGGKSAENVKTALGVIRRHLDTLKK